VGECFVCFLVGLFVLGFEDVGILVWIIVFGLLGVDFGFVEVLVYDGGGELVF